MARVEAAPEASSLSRGLRLLVAITDAEAAGGEGSSVMRLSEAVGIEKSRTSRILQDLTALGLIERDPESREFRLGGRLLALAARVGEPWLLSGARPVLRGLVADLGESAYLHVLVPDGVLTVCAELSPRAMHVASVEGAVLPLWCAASARALLLDRDASELAPLLARAPHIGAGRVAATSAAEVMDRIAEAAVAGVALAVDELDDDVVEVAAPVRDRAGRIVAALSVSGPGFRFRDAAVTAGDLVRQAAENLSARAPA